MNIRELFNKKKCVFSFEMFPPKKESADMGAMLDTVNGLKKLSPDYISITYGAGVAAVECVADEAEKTVRLNTAIGEKLTMRFSPGYGDMPLSLSRAIASATDAQRRTGVTVTEGDMLVPSKSVTAVIGIVDAGKSNTYARK